MGAQPGVRVLNANEPSWGEGPSVHVARDREDACEPAAHENWMHGPGRSW
jgi:hypothetical protein